MAKNNEKIKPKQEIVKDSIKTESVIVAKNNEKIKPKPEAKKPEIPVKKLLDPPKKLLHNSSAGKIKKPNIPSVDKKPISKPLVPPVKKDVQYSKPKTAVNPKKPEKNQKMPEEKKQKNGAIAKYSSELREIIEGSILQKSNFIKWEDLVGLDHMKKKMQECIVLPIRNPKLFTGLLSPSKGILLFGPPGNGKTMVAKAVATQCGDEVTFFNMSAGALTSRYFGDSEKLVKALFEVAVERQPSVIFIDEIDSILGARSSGELEVTRRLKTEFLVQFDGVGTKAEDRVLVIGATNRPYDLDDAVLRRFTARIFLPLPGLEARIQMITTQLKSIKHTLDKSDIEKIGKKTDGYSFADLRALCQEAAMEPMRNLGFSVLVKMEKEDAPPVNPANFEAALSKVPKSVSQKSIDEFEKWNKLNQK